MMKAKCPYCGKMITVRVPGGHADGSVAIMAKHGRRNNPCRGWGSSIEWSQVIITEKKESDS